MKNPRLGRGFFIYEEELSEKVATLTEINTKLEFESLQGQESEVILDENGLSLIHI